MLKRTIAGLICCSLIGCGDEGEQGRPLADGNPVSIEIKIQASEIDRLKRKWVEVVVRPSFSPEKGCRLGGDLIGVIPERNLEVVSLGEVKEDGSCAPAVLRSEFNPRPRTDDPVLDRISIKDASLTIDIDIRDAFRNRGFGVGGIGTHFRPGEKGWFFVGIPGDDASEAAVEVFFSTNHAEKQVLIPGDSMELVEVEHGHRFDFHVPSSAPPMKGRFYLDAVGVPLDIQGCRNASCVGSMDIYAVEGFEREIVR